MDLGWWLWREEVELENMVELDELLVDIWLEKDTMGIEVEVECDAGNVVVDSHGNTDDIVWDSVWGVGLIGSGRMLDVDIKIKELDTGVEIKVVDTGGEIKDDGDDWSRRLEQSSTGISVSL